MQKPEIPLNESDRLAALDRYKILDTIPEQVYDDLAQLAADICGTPIALISLVDKDRQWFKSRVGVDVSETPRDISFCSHAVAANAILNVPDASLDPRFADNPLVAKDPNIRFYAGVPLITDDNFALGTICVIDRQPRNLTEQQIRQLEALSRLVISQLELRLKENSSRHLASIEIKLRKEVEVSVQKLHSMNSQLQEQEAQLRDSLSDQVKSTHRLLESEERLRTVLTSIKEGITFSDDSGYFSIFNDGMETLTGYTPIEANASKDFTTFLYPDRAEHDKALQRLQQLQEKGQSMTVETRICHRDGTFKDVLVSSRLMTYKDKRMYLSSYYDITERKKVETQLRYQSERERLLNAILLKIQCELNLDQILAITVKEAQELLRIDRVAIYQFQEDWSGKFVVEAVNEPRFSIIGKTVYDECLNQDYVEKHKNRPISSINDVDLADLSPCHTALLQRFHVKANIVASISFGDTLWGLLIAHQCLAPRQWEGFEIDLLKQLANHVAIAIQQAKLFERVQELNKSLEIQVADRTQQLKQSLSQLERALLKEKELNELKSQFISRASHEFRTPLATIQTASELLRNYGHKMSDDKKIERFDKIQREVKNMTNLLEEVLIVGKSESGKFDLQPEEINLEDFCLEIIEQTKVIGDGKHQVVFKNINVPIKISIDPKLFKQIISNLLSNAIKYSPDSREVNFTISLTNDRISQLLLEFKDRGIGIPLIDQEKIFDHFYRAQNVGMIVGTGLGMAIIKNSVDILGGTIQLTSVENKGTTVKVKLPYPLPNE
ncbi:MAG: GAF domain-containing protein [Pseudanabaena sp.]